ncbi:hypothetical protein QVA66_11085 [Staphylococcus chromogenes]|nr:hypothetical protein [Staphylococcus chromogenes]
MIPDIHHVGQANIFFYFAKRAKFDEFMFDTLGSGIKLIMEGSSVKFYSDRGYVLCDVYAVASVAVEPATLLWRWQPLPGEEEYFRGDVAIGYKAFGEKHGLSGFSSLEVPYQFQGDQLEALGQVVDDVESAGFQIFGPQALFYHYPINEAGSQVIWALTNLRNEHGPVQFPMPTLTELLVSAPRVLSTSVDDPRFSLERLAAFYEGVTTTVEEFPTRNLLCVTYVENHERYHVIEVHKDEHGRVTSIGSHLNCTKEIAENAVREAVAGVDEQK